MTKCTAMITLKVSNGEFNNQDIKAALQNRLQAIEDQLGACQQMIKIKSGTNEEIISRKKENKLCKEKEKVSGTKNLSFLNSALASKMSEIIKRWSQAESFTIFENHAYSH